MLGKIRNRLEFLGIVLLWTISLALCLATYTARLHGAEPSALTTPAEPSSVPALELPELPIEARRRPRPRPAPAPTPRPQPSPEPAPSPSPNSDPQSYGAEMPKPEASNSAFELMQLTTEQRRWFVNNTNPGSCVQCSIAMCGVHCNDIRASTLLWDTPYGEHVWHGSWPQRVAQYCDERGIQAWNVTGETTWDWMRWAAKTGRFAAIGAGTAHFQTLYGYDPETRTWYVCNNQTPGKVDRYTDAAFRRLHLASGQWCVVLRRSSSAPPRIVEWWK